jgi:lysozyme
MTISKLGLTCIEVFEGLELQVYKDIAGHPSIGYGHEIEQGEDFSEGITQSQAETILMNDLAVAEGAILRLVTAPLSQWQFDALVDFIYNEGQGSFANSTLLKLLNQGNYQGAAAQLEIWDVSAGKVNLVLLARRRCERVIFTAGTT